MLLSSLALACGVVYHGVFKDAKTARERIEAVEAQLDLERGFLAGGSLPRDEAITRNYGEELRRLQGLQRDLRLGRMGVSITGRNDDASMLVRAWRWIRRKGVANAMNGLPRVAQGVASGAYRPIDYDCSSDVIANLVKARSELSFAIADLSSVEATIRRSLELTAFEVMLPLVRRKSILEGDVQASVAEDVERKSHATITGELLTLHARSVIANGTSVKPFFEGVRADLAARVPYVAVAIPAPQGDDHD